MERTHFKVVFGFNEEYCHFVFDIGKKSHDITLATKDLISRKDFKKSAERFKTYKYW